MKSLSLASVLLDTWSLVIWCDVGRERGRKGEGERERGRGRERVLHKAGCTL